MTRVLIDFRDLPDWARDEVGQFIGHKKRPHTHVELHDGVVSIGAVWHDHWRRRIVGYMPPDEDGDRVVRIDSAYYESLINATPSEFAAHQGGDLGVPVDGAVLTINRSPIGTSIVTMYIHKTGPYKHLIETLPSGIELSQIQMGVLDLYCGLTSAGRKDNMERYRIPKKLVSMVAEELQDMGYVSIAKNGATRATLEGKQARGASLTPFSGKWEWSWYKWGECYDWRTRKYTGFALPIIEEYQAKLKEMRQ